MKNHISYCDATFTPQSYKTFAGALEAYLVKQFPQIGGSKIRQVMVNDVTSMIRKFYPETSHLNQGQTPWVTVHKDAKSSYGKRIQETPLQSIVLDLVRPEDITERAQGKKLREMKIEAVARICKQAYEQDGCMTNAELAILLKISTATVGKYIKTWEEETREVLPRRGTIHDMGPTLTHKKIIIEKLFIEKKTVQQVSRETYHSLPAIQRYIGTFKRVLICHKKDFSTEEISYAIGITKRLVNEYEVIIQEYKDRGYVLDQISSADIAVETLFDQAPNLIQGG